MQSLQPSLLMSLKFTIKEKLPSTLARAGKIETAHGVIETPAFVTVGTKATVKALTPEQVRELGAQVVLANTYHLYLEPGDELVHKAGGLHNFMNWSGPTMTDSGGFQVFSLGAAYENKLSKVLLTKREIEAATAQQESGSRELGAEASGRLGGRGEGGLPGQDDQLAGATKNTLVKIDEEGVTFKSYLDGSQHRFTPERSMQIQHNLGADIIFAFDECTSPLESYEYQKKSMDRTHRWAERSLAEHQRLLGASPCSLFGIVQGGRYRDLREESARVIGGMGFDGFGIGGSFDKEDLTTAVGWVTEILPEEKPRHLLGIGEPLDLFAGVEVGIDTFDCVIPTRMARHGQFFSKHGKSNISNAKYRNDFTPPP